jgi:hypothetical protein
MFSNYNITMSRHLANLFTRCIIPEIIATNGEYKNSSRLCGTFLSNYKKIDAGESP